MFVRKNLNFYHIHIFKNEKPVDHIRVIIRIRQLITDTDKHLRLVMTQPWEVGQTDGRMEGTKYVISLASRSINMQFLVFSGTSSWLYY